MIGNWRIRSVTAAESDAGRRNMLLLVQLRWLAVVGQLATVIVVHWGMGIALPLAPLLLAPAILILINLVTIPVVFHRAAISNAELTMALLLDVVALTWQLFHSGGVTNPFLMLYLLQIVLGAILLRPATSWAIVGAVFLALPLLAFNQRPLEIPPALQGGPLNLQIAGSLVCLALVSVLLVVFVTRISRNLSDRDAALAAIRQQAAEEDHIVRMGMLASGAAHELGTPLSTMAVLAGDWRQLPALAGDTELQADLSDMIAAIESCKTIVSGILMSAGEARGIAPARTTARRFLRDIVAEWKTDRRYPAIMLTDRLDADVPILADPALRQVIGNAIDNALHVSPQWVGILAERENGMLMLEISDRGPGFTAEMLQAFGRPYHSTRDKPGGGLGLFLLVNVVRKLGGEASARNLPGGGAAVSIRLPLSSISVPAT
ncbi:ATP-binding protein [Sandaracinobacteroides hominis]|uniref:ATP-binding protein n=1 Tax=Sandaracinobacteroides hominis TaxID=2780086 RepID=UPI0018F44AB8|nr:ATP-binding protein [Sandaracinobacteroides hominis]